MNKNLQILDGHIHQVTPDIEAILKNNFSLLEKRNGLTELARNERICRATMPKKEETRQKHLVRLSDDILGGKKRPCCRPGCPHHRESAKKRFK